MLFRRFVGLNIDDPVWDVTVFTKNLERLIEGEVAEQRETACDRVRAESEVPQLAYARRTQR